MNLHHLTLEKPSSVTHTVAGNFFSAKSQDIAIVRGSQDIEILTQNLSNTLFYSVLVLPSFSQIRCIMAFRPVGFNKDFLVITSDSGMLSVVELIDATKITDFESHRPHNLNYRMVLQETVYRSGCRRIAPGSYIAKDPKGRALLLAAVERNKTIYLTSKNGENNTISVNSPLEANIQNTLTYDIVGLDNGYNNPCFVAIEADYGDVENKESALYTRTTSKAIVIYELDLGLNQVIRKKNIPIPFDARMLLSVPQTDTITSGFIIIFDKKVEYRSLNGETISEIEFPTRIDNYKTKRHLQIITQAGFKLKNNFYFILQNELGDLFKLWVPTQTSLKLEYLCTDKISSNFCITKTEYIFKSNENADHSVIAIIDIENNNNNSSIGSFYVPIPISDWRSATSTTAHMNIENYDGHKFNPDSKFEGMKIVQSFQNLSGLIDSKFADLTGDNIGQLYALQSGINGSSLASLKFSFEVQKLTEVVPPIRPKNLFTVRSLFSENQKYQNQTQYLLLTIEGKTCVLIVGERITEVNDPVGFATEDETIHLFDIYTMDRKRCGWIQITTREIRVVKGEKRFTQLAIPSGKKIKLAANYEDKLLTINNSNQIEFFKYVNQEIESESRADLDQEVLAICIFGGSGRSGNLMAALGFADNTIRIYSFDSKSSLTRLSMLALKASPNCLEFSEGHLLIGLSNGMLDRIYIDPMTGALGEIRMRNLGSKPIRIFRNLSVSSATETGFGTGPKTKGIFICGEQNYFIYEEKDIFELINLNLGENNRIKSLVPIENQIGERCFMYITEGGAMKIVQILNEKKGVYKDRTLTLSNTGRKILINKENLSLVIIESQNRIYDQISISKKIEKMNSHLRQEINHTIEFQTDHLKLLSFLPKCTNWLSNISIVNPFTFVKQSVFTLSNNNKHILTAQIVQFKELDNQQMLLVSVCEDHDILKKTFSNSYIIAFSFVDNNKKLSQMSITKVDEMVTELQGFKGKLLAGCGSYLRLYDMGKKQLLKKCEFKRKFTLINGIKCINQRIWLSDAMDSIHLLRFDSEQNQFSEMADDVLPRYITCFEILDFNTVAAADKFGNFFVLRLVQGADEDQIKDAVSYNLRWESGYLNGAPSKFEQSCSFYDVNLITSIQKITNVRNKFEYIIATNVEGKICAFIPFETKSDVDFFRHFELLMRMDDEKKHFITARNHLLYRGYYCAVKDITDGDLCEQFLRYDPDEKKKIGENLERTNTEILKKIEDIRFLLV